MSNLIPKRVCHWLVDLAPEKFLAALREKHLALVAKQLNQPRHFDWRQTTLPSNPQSFEDLIGLFWLSPLNRGIMRLDFDEASTLFKAVRGLPNPRGVEIGRFNGGSTALLSVAIGPQGSVTSIDVAPKDDALLRTVLGSLGTVGRVELIIGDANAIPQKETYDFVFIDGDHSYEGAKRDHNRWGKTIRPGGLIFHHDMANHRPLATQWNELRQLRADILNKQSAVVELTREVGSLSVFRRTPGKWVEV
jgi:predicted O-methyltransferase YrrM